MPSRDRSGVRNYISPIAESTEFRPFVEHRRACALDNDCTRAEVSAVMSRPTTKRTSPAVVALLSAMVVGLLVMRNDFWQWDEPGYLLFGALPVGLWWQALATILSSIVMALMVKLAWPPKLEADAM